ncbi:MAG: helix-turn-helix transcriptional regulator [Planctomycetes bacterium]|nr:helix-turn-helix transcriptional regulator [Planctomycetota bacterium]
MQLKEVGPGKFFACVTRPAGAADAFPFRVTFSNMDVVDCRKDRFTVLRHRHPDYEIIVVRKGSYRCRINGITVDAPAPSIVILKPGDHHEDQCEKPVMFHAITVRIVPGPQPDESANILGEIGAEAQVVADRTGVFSALADRMGEEGQRNDPFAVGVLDALAFEFVWEMLRAVPRALIDPKLLGGITRHAFALELHQLFARHLHHHLGLRAMAKELAVSERTLSARCRSEFKTSPTRLFMRHKMDRARILLAQTSLSIGEISSYLGFENPYHFSTAYKRLHGVPPTQHRAR